ncbi:DUF222 domain-containing protein [Arthrobacter sp. NPDC057388]|uniref:DUF222 domain-containing protein n=1 Tax=Arthrobacter sp. NPDC057388 TaxID=3346116 RepID=UPI0036415122
MAVAEVLEAIAASALAMAAEVRRAADPGSGDAGLESVPDPVDPLGEQATVCLDGLTGVAGMEAWLAAVKVHLAAGYVTADAAMAVPGATPQDAAIRQMAVRAEVAGALTISEGAAERLLVEAGLLTTELPVTLAALQAGRISWQHARIMCDETEGLSPEAAAAFEAHFLDPDAPGAARGCFAGDLAPARFRAKARYWRERHHQDSIEKRHSKSVKDRRLEYTPDRDGMAWFSAYLPADQAAGIWNRTTAIARGLQGPTETRTLTQLRADVFSTTLLTPNPGAAGVEGALAGGGTAGSVLAGDVPSPAAQVLVTVPVFSLLGHTDEPATLDGYGPIPPSMARRLVADGATSFLRVLVDPRDGAPLEIGRTSYRLTKPMRHWLHLRDAKCTFPNCSNHSLDNDADHILAWADGGGTGVANLGQPCPKHHRLKHATAWRPVGATKNNPPGWTSPAGRHYPAEHQDWEPPTWPKLMPGQDCAELMASQACPEPPLVEDWPEPPGRFGAPPDQDWPEPPLVEDRPGPPGWFGAPPDQACPEPPGWFGAPPEQALPEPPDWLDSPDQPDEPDDFDGYPGLASYRVPESSVAPEDSDSDRWLQAVYGQGLPLPPDPLPDWPTRTAA